MSSVFGEDPSVIGLKGVLLSSFGVVGSAGSDNGSVGVETSSVVVGSSVVCSGAVGSSIAIEVGDGGVVGHDGGVGNI